MTTTRVKPTVILIIDQSGSMNEDFHGVRSRWDTLRDFLLIAPNGLIADLQTQVKFGLALYSADSGGSNPLPIGPCPMIEWVAPAFDNYAAIEQVYRRAQPIEDTPTGDSIDAVVKRLNLPKGPDANDGPIVFILATDGEPDRCEQLDPNSGPALVMAQAESVAAVTRAFGLGVRTFAISVGQGTVSARHMEDIANAGLGRGPTDPPAEYWVAGNDQSLREALEHIVGTQLGCEVRLSGMVKGDPCVGRVTLNSNPLGCGDPNGWSLLDPMHIRLSGSACQTLKTTPNAILDVTFPCGAVAPL